VNPKYNSQTLDKSPGLADALSGIMPLRKGR